MQLSGQALQLSASDLVGHVSCRYLTQLDLKVARGTLPKPAFYDPSLAVLIERGRQHEQGYLDHLREDSGEAARLFRDDGARDSEMMPPGSAATLADAFVALGSCRRQSSNLF